MLTWVAKYAFEAHSNNIYLQETQQNCFFADLFAHNSLGLSFSFSPLPDLTASKQNQQLNKSTVRNQSNNTSVIPAVDIWKLTANYSFTPLHQSFVIFLSFIMTCLSSEGII